MTARQVWEGMLTELSKVNAPSMLLQDFNYFFNKAINQYINKRYNIYDINQQTTDDLRVLKATTILDVNKAIDKQPLAALVNLGAGKSKLFAATYEVDLPYDYLHILNCVCIYRVNKRWKCYNAGDYVQFSAKRLNADSWSVIVNDYYNRPLPERPYFYIHNINMNEEVPTNPARTSDATATNGLTETTWENYTTGTDMPDKAAGNNGERYNVTITQASEKSIADLTKNGVDKALESDAEGISKSTSKIAATTGVEGLSNFPRTIKLNGGENSIDVVERETAYRYGNASKVRMEIRYGHDDTVFTLVKVFVDYIKTPQHIRLTQEQVNLTEDTSQIMEFPDYVCQEIINELTMLVMENTADPRLQTNPTVTQSIANPAQAQTPQQQPQQQQRG